MLPGEVTGGQGAVSCGHVPLPTVSGSEVAQLESSLCELAAQIHSAQAELIRLLGRFDQLEGWQGIGIRSVGHWATIHLGIDARTASAQAVAGHRLAVLPAISDAASAGELGWAKVRLVTQVAEPHTEQRWLALAREMSVTQLARVSGAYRRASETDQPGRADNARERRGLWLFDEPDGLVRVTGLLEPDDAAVLRAALAAQGELLWRSPDGDDAAAADKASDTTPALPLEADPSRAARDTAATRRVDALVSLARAARAAQPVDDGDDLTQVVLHVDVDVLDGRAEVGRCHIEHGSAVSTGTARRLACDATLRPLIRRTDGTPLDVGRARRLVSRRQRRALRARDHGCVFPGCAQSRHVDAHHIVHWADGGTTDMANLALLCRHHHRLLHEGGYAIEMVADRPRVRRSDGTMLRPPDAPLLRVAGGPDELRSRSTAAGHAIDRHTAGARSGGVAAWSPRDALDGLVA